MRHNYFESMSISSTLQIANLNPDCLLYRDPLLDKTVQGLNGIDMLVKLQPHASRLSFRAEHQKYEAVDCTLVL